MLIFRKPFFLIWTHNGFRLDVGEAFMKGFHYEIQLRVGQIVSEWGVSENVVDAIVGKL